MRDSGHVAVCTCVEKMLVFSGTQRYLSCSCKKQRYRQEDAQQRDSRLALARLTHSLASNMQVSLWYHQGSVMEAQSSECHRRAAVEGAP